MRRAAGNCRRRASGDSPQIAMRYLQFWTASSPYRMLIDSRHGCGSYEEPVDMVDRAELARRIARAKALRVVARAKIAAAHNLCHRARNLCHVAVLQRALDNSLSGITPQR